MPIIMPHKPDRTFIWLSGLLIGIVPTSCSGDPCDLPRLTFFEMHFCRQHTKAKNSYQTHRSQIERSRVAEPWSRQQDGGHLNYSIWLEMGKRIRPKRILVMKSILSVHRLLCCCVPGMCVIDQNVVQERKKTPGHAGRPSNNELCFSH